MRTHKSHIIFFGILTAISLLVVICLSALQIVFEGKECFSILNSIVICIFTSCLLIFFQSIINYKSQKRVAVLDFYKDACLLENKIINDHYVHCGFNSPHEGLIDYLEIVTLYQKTLRYSFEQISFFKKDNDLLTAINNLYNLYKNEIGLYRSMVNVCEEAIELQENPKGLDPSTIDNINSKLSEALTAIIDNYNSNERLKESSTAYKIIEKYLFHNK